MSKRYAAAFAKIEPKLYTIPEAISLVKSTASAKFDETVELAVRLGVDPKQSDQMVRGYLVLPHGTGRRLRVLVFAKGEKEREAREAGADYAGAEDLVEKITQGWMEFDKAVATPDMMSAVGRLGKLLGPRGLMPNPKTGTVTFNLAKTIQELRQGRVEYKTEKTGIIHVAIGKVSHEARQLEENLLAVLEAIAKAKPATAKGQYILSIALSSTMGPGVRVDPAEAIRLFE